MAEFDKLHNQLQDLINEGSDSQALQGVLKSIMPADIASILDNFDPEHQCLLFNALPDEEDKQEVLSFLEGSALDTIIQQTDPAQIAHYLEEMPPDEAADVLEDQSEELVNSILAKVEPKTAAELKSLSLYREGTAGSLMTTDFLHVNSHMKIKDILLNIKNEDEQLETVEFGFVLTEAGKILGQFHIQDILRASENDFVLKFIEEDFLYVKDTDSQDVVLQMMTRHALSFIPVVDHSGVIKGIITADDMLDVAREIMDQDFYQMVGTSGDPNERSIWARVFHRAPWLACTLIGGTISAFIIRLFDIELKNFTFLTIFIPFVIGMAGNVGIQSATIIVRDLVSQGNRRSLNKNIIREILTGFSNAVLFGLTTLLLLFVLGKLLQWPSDMVAVSVASGLFLAMMFASLIGATIPNLFIHLKIDPAISSGPIITALIDIIGLTIYLVISTFLLHLFGIYELNLPNF